MGLERTCRSGGDASEFDPKATFDDPPGRLAAELKFGNEAQTERVCLGDYSLLSRI